MRKKANVFGFIAFLLLLAVAFNVAVLCVASAQESNYIAVLSSWAQSIRGWFAAIGNRAEVSAMFLQ